MTVCGIDIGDGLGCPPVVAGQHGASARPPRAWTLNRDTPTPAPGGEKEGDGKSLAAVLLRRGKVRSGSG